MYSSDAGDQVVQVVPESSPDMSMNFLSQVAPRYNMVCTKTAQDSDDDSITDESAGATGVVLESTPTATSSDIIGLDVICV